MVGTTISKYEVLSKLGEGGRAASSLNHPNIITIHDIVQTDDGECIVMELVKGQTLGDMLSQLDSARGKKRREFVYWGFLCVHCGWRSLFCASCSVETR